MNEIFWLLISGCVFLLSLVLCILFIPLARFISHVFNIVDHPSQRKIHTAPMPRTGGFAMFFSFIVTIILGLFLFEVLNRQFFYLPSDTADFLFSHYARLKTVIPVLRIVMLAATTVFLLGLWDDLHPLNSRKKLLIEILVAFILWWGGIRMSLFIDAPILSLILTIAWIVGITNSFNLLDNMDGLSAGVAFVISCMFFVSCFRGGQFFVSLILALMMGITAGFLIFNFPPAKIFMGDAGSLFIGLVLASISLIATYYRYDDRSKIVIVMPLLLFAVPIFDTFSVMWIRLKERRSILAADKKHFSHRLTSLGMTQKQAVLFIYLATLCLGAGAIVLKDLTLWGGYWIFIQALAIIAIIVLLERAGNNVRR